MLNICVLTGNLGADPDITYTNDGVPIANFNLAFNSGRDKTSKEQKVSWIKVTAFNKLAEIAQGYLHKGAKIAITGALDQERWQDNNGDTKTNYKLLANSIEFIKINGEHNEEHQNTNGDNGEEEDLPF
jgi:single-strand DNA-binding protein